MVGPERFACRMCGTWRAPVLHDVRQLVSQEMYVVLRLTASQENVVAMREGSRVDHVSSLVCGEVFMDTHVAQVGAQKPFQGLARDRIERSSRPFVGNSLHYCRPIRAFAHGALGAQNSLFFLLVASHQRRGVSGFVSLVASQVATLFFLSVSRWFGNVRRSSARRVLVP